MGATSRCRPRLFVVQANPALDGELAQEAERLARAEQVLGHAFRDRALLLRALTHSSAKNERFSAVGDNESLEILGDAVLSLVTLEDMLRATPDAREGELTVRRAAYVSAAALGRAATASGLPALLRTGKSMAPQSAGSAGADLMEALIAAVYLDGGLDAARACVARLLGEPPRDVAARVQNPKGALSERLQRVLREAPCYDVETEGPIHTATFRARATVRGRVLGEGTGPSKRAATEAAAGAALATLPEDDGELRARFAPSAT